MPVDLEAFVLVGGNSRRFGSDKAFYELEGESLAARAVSAISTAFPDIPITLVAASDEQFGIKLKSLEGPVVFDLRKGFGAWSGLDAALSHSRSEWTLVMACDLPFVTPEFLRSIIGKIAADVDAVVPRQRDGRPQPLCAVYRTAVIKNIVETALGRESVPALASIFEQVNSIFVDAPGDVLRNVNTPADIA